MLTCIYVKFIFDSVRAGLSSSANILQNSRCHPPSCLLAVFAMFLAIILPSSSCSSYGGPQLSRQNQKLHGKNKNITAKPKTSWQKQNTSRQNQTPHSKNKIPHSKTKNLTAKPNTSQRKQNSFGFVVGICFCRKVFGFCCEVFGFAVRSLVLP